MNTNIELKVHFEGEGIPLTIVGDCDLYAYPDKGLYWTEKIGNLVKNSHTVAEFLENLGKIYMEETPNIPLFSEIGSSSEITNYATVKVVETITGDFAYSELEMVAEDAEIYPNCPLGVLYEYEVEEGKDKPRKVFAITEDGEAINITNYM